MADEIDPLLFLERLDAAAKKSFTRISFLPALRKVSHGATTTDSRTAAIPPARRRVGFLLAAACCFAC